ncbi:hypothetical protein, partial [Streptomyces sp. NPDC059742]|uniref:hypothetical protein n=1 Tax=Streptomyces sp. NPDC059742 TaxID=3346927 RepID=UPI00364CD42B
MVELAAAGFWLPIRTPVRCSLPSGSRSTTARPGIPLSRAMHCARASKPRNAFPPTRGPDAAAVFTAVLRARAAFLATGSPGSP